MTLVKFWFSNILLLAVFLSHTGSANDLDNRKLKGQVRTMREKKWQHYSDSTKVPALISESIMRYNKDGMETSSFEPCKQSSTYSTLCGSDFIFSINHINDSMTYDSKKRLIFQLAYDCNNILKDSTTYRYNENEHTHEEFLYSKNGKLISYTSYNSAGKILNQRNYEDSIGSWSMHTYDSANNDLNYFYEHGNKIVETNYFYKTRHKLIERTTKFQPEQSIRKELFTYNDNDSLIKRVTITNSIQEKVVYVYSKAGKKIKDTSFSYANGSTNINWYCENGEIDSMKRYEHNLLTELIHYNKSGNELFMCKYSPNEIKYRTMQYDEHGNMTHRQCRTMCLSINKKSKVETFKQCELYNESAEYVYDKVGNLIRKTEYAEGKIELITEYEIAYY